MPTSAHAAQRRRFGSRVGSREASSEGQLRTLLAAADLVGVLQRDIDARTLNVSGSGCLLETASPVDEGTVAQLRMRIGGVEYRDDVRVIRCSRVEGAGATHHVGVEFAWTTQPGARSLRRKVRMAPPRAKAMVATRDTKRPVS